MKASQIIQADYRKRGEDPNKYLAGLSKLLEIKGAILLQEGDTVFVIINIGNQKAEVHLYTQDNPLQVTKAMNEFVKKLQNSEITTIYSEEEQPELIQMLQYLDINVEPSDNPNYEWMAMLGDNNV
jgi:hypothetical protein